MSSHSITRIIDSHSCIDHLLIISIDLLLVLLITLNFICKSTRTISTQSSFRCLSPLQIVVTVSNCCLGIAYVVLGLYVLYEKVQPFHQWLTVLFHGLVWVLVGLTVGLKRLQSTFARVASTISCAFAVFLCITSVMDAIQARKASAKVILDVLSFPSAAALLLFSFFKGSQDTEVNEGEFYVQLKDESEFNENTTPFATAGCLSRYFFWWLNPLMNKGSTQPLTEADIPRLRCADRAESCYAHFTSQLNRRKQTQQSNPPSILWTLVSCHRNEILVSGFFALLKVLTVSAGPLLLKAFIAVSEGKCLFSEYDAYLLALSMLCSKGLESLAQRQWFFRTRLIGLQIRSVFSAAIYEKQLRLSCAARTKYSSGDITNYVTVDAYRIGEFPYWFHQAWTTILQLCIALFIVYSSVGLATLSALAVIVLTALCNSPLAKLQLKFQAMLMDAQDARLKAMAEALVSMRVLKLYAWEAHFRRAIEALRDAEYGCLKSYQVRKAYDVILFWASPVLVSAATFATCCAIGVPLNSGSVFTFVAALGLVQEPIRAMPDVIGAVIQAKVAFERLVRFLGAREIEGSARRRFGKGDGRGVISMMECGFCWDERSARPSLRKVSLEVNAGEKVAVCGEVGSGKSTLLAAILGEVPCVKGMIQVCGRIAYVSQTAWIQTGTIQENILFGSTMDEQRYREAIERCSLAKDLEMLPFGDQTEIGERGVNLSGGQKQRIQLARALYQDADIYLLDDPFSAVDAETSTTLFNEYVMGALSGKTVLLVTHQVDFLPGFDSVLLMSDGEILCAAPYLELLTSSKEFHSLVNAHKVTAGSERADNVTSPTRSTTSKREIKEAYTEQSQKKAIALPGIQLIKQEERERGDTGLKPYMQYLNQDKGFMYFCMSILLHCLFIASQILQNTWMAANVQKPQTSSLQLIAVYAALGFGSIFFLFLRSVVIVVMGMATSKSLFSQLLGSLFHAPMLFFDSTPLGRILSRVSSDLSIVDVELPFGIVFTTCSSMVALSNLGVLMAITWPVLIISVPVLYLTIQLKRYYAASAKELMRISGTTKSQLANHLAETIAGATTIRAFGEEERFFSKNLDLIDKNASPFFHTFTANEWLILRLEMLSAIVLCSSALAMALLPQGTLSSGFVGMALSYGLSLNQTFIYTIRNQTILSNYIISVERLIQYMYIPSEAPEVIEGNRPTPNWPAVGRVEFQDLKIRYRPETPLVLHGISCVFEGGHKIGIVGRTGSGKTTLIGALFRLVEPAGGKIIIDGLNISEIGLHDLRSKLGIIPQDPTLFHGTVRFNLDPLSKHTDDEIWKVLEKCQLQEAVKEKELGLDSMVVEDGSNWSMGQRQLFCLGRALLRSSRILVLDEATASIDNATDSILQKTIRSEFADCTVITVAHRIPTVMDCTMVLAISDGRLVEFDEPAKLMKSEGSLFRMLVKEYWSHSANANSHSMHSA
ncbi:ABC transporter C family member 10 [Acorus calamus]|uniref:ABC transporter C family member 10 n=1 Tax=Acorus calamus TaxID=4465 RepID=A0AAV9CCA5_ACOCL|nr:ABC transporter C family member 10 [Acorus calamus]